MLYLITIKVYIRYLTNGNKEFEPYLAFWENEMSKLSLSGKYDYKVPYYNIDGDMDCQTNYQLACEYFDDVNAHERRYTMKEKTDWTPKNKSKNLHSSTSRKEDSGLMKAGLAVAAGLIVALLAKGVKNSDYYD